MPSVTLLPVVATAYWRRNAANAHLAVVNRVVSIIIRFALTIAGKGRHSWLHLGLGVVHALHGSYVDIATGNGVALGIPLGQILKSGLR